MAISAVIFDLGGVVFDSPLTLIREFEQRHGLPEHFVARIVGGYGGAEGLWHRLERGELEIADFCGNFDVAAREQGHPLDTGRLMREMAEQVAPRPAMLAAIRKLRESGLRVAALTNNWVTDEGYDARLEPLRGEFHVFVESCKVGMRKPETRIYDLCCERVGVPHASAVFLDDMGPNLKAARALGMTTIKVGDPAAAIEELSRVVGFAL